MIKLKRHHKSGLFGLGGPEEGSEQKQSLYGLGTPTMAPADMNIGQSYGQKGGSTASTGQPSTGSVTGDTIKKASRRAFKIQGPTPKEMAAQMQAKADLAKLVKSIEGVGAKWCAWKLAIKNLPKIKKLYEDRKHRLDTAKEVVSTLEEWGKAHNHRVYKLFNFVPHLKDSIAAAKQALGQQHSKTYWQQIKMPDPDPLYPTTPLLIYYYRTTSIYGAEWNEYQKLEPISAGIQPTGEPQSVSAKSTSTSAKYLKGMEEVLAEIHNLKPSFAGTLPEWLVKERAKSKVNPTPWWLIHQQALNFLSPQYAALVEKNKKAIQTQKDNIVKKKAEMRTAFKKLGDFDKWADEAKFSYDTEFWGDVDEGGIKGLDDMIAAQKWGEGCFEKGWASAMAAKAEWMLKKAKKDLAKIKQQNAYRLSLKAKAIALQEQMADLDAQMEKVLEKWDGKGEMPDAIFDEWSALDKDKEMLTYQLDKLASEVEGLIEWISEARTGLVNTRAEVTKLYNDSKALNNKSKEDGKEPDDQQQETDDALDGIKDDVINMGDEVKDIGDQMLDTMEKLNIDRPDLVLKIEENSEQAQENIDAVDPKEKPAKGLPWLAIAAVGLGAAKAIPLAVAAVGAGAGMYLYTKATEE